jgi:outer membrane protein assembly factor BamB
MRSQSLSLCFLFFLSAMAQAADWPQWRGPNRDGVAAAAPKEWPKELKQAWKIEVGEGHSSPVVVGEKVYILARQGDEEVLRCVSLADGKEIWVEKFKADADLDGAVGWHGKTPKSTPTVADGRVFVLHINGVLSCYAADTGKLVWRKTFEKLFPKSYPIFGSATSPIVFDGLVAVWVGSGDKGAFMAFDVKTGAVKWSMPGDGPGYTSPVLAELAGRRQLVTQSQKSMVGVDPKTGKALWTLRFMTGYDQNSVTPLIVGDRVIYTGYQKSLFAATVTKAGLKDSWVNRKHPMYMSSPILAEKRIVGLSESGNSVAVINAADGKEIWAQGTDSKDYAAFIKVGTNVLMQTTEGKVVVFDPQAAKYQPIAEYTVAEDKTWAHPAFTGEELLIKDKAHLYAWKVR